MNVFKYSVIQSASQMTIRIYIDTNVYLDYFLDRMSDTGRPLGQIAEAFFFRILAGDFIVLISRKVIEELYGNMESIDSAKLLFKMLKDKKKLIQVDYDDEDLHEAERRDPLNRNVALHAILANRHKADFLVTRNKRDFVKCADLIQTKFPEDV